MTVFNLGSVNIDHVYQVPHFPAPGETLATNGYMRTLGGKGANQSIALARAGSTVRHIGAANPADQWIIDDIKNAGVDVTAIQPSKTPTGHAIVSVADNGENQILLFPGANQAIDMAAAIAVLDDNEDGDWVLLQNETNGASAFVAAAKERGLKIAYSAAPFDADIALGLLPDCDLLIVNEGEAAALVNALGNALTPTDNQENNGAQIVEQFGLAHLVITKGGDGAEYIGQNSQTIQQQPFSVDVVDTTGAGDCFYGFVLAAIMAGETAETAMRQASAAAALQVTRNGAAEAIPSRQDMIEFMATQLT
jgi:ribokinase